MIENLIKDGRYIIYEFGKSPGIPVEEPKPGKIYNVKLDYSLERGVALTTPYIPSILEGNFLVNQEHNGPFIKSKKELHKFLENIADRNYNRNCYGEISKPLELKLNKKSIDINLKKTITDESTNLTYFDLYFKVNAKVKFLGRVDLDTDWSTVVRLETEAGVKEHKDKVF